MKILIVDDNANTKCAGIMEECKKRGIEVEIAIASKQAIYNICSDREKNIDGIILDMELPIFPYNQKIKEREGENVLKQLESHEIYIPTLVFSKTEMNKNYKQVYDQMKEWNQDNEKFFAFLEKVQKEKEKREELERLKEEQKKEDEKKKKTKKFPKRRVKKRSN